MRTTSWVYSSDDGGETWQPFFYGATIRTITAMAASRATETAPGRWWIVAGGELWGTYSAESLAERNTRSESARWARSRLRHTPPLWAVTDDVMAHLRLDPSHRSFNPSRSSALLPHLFVTAFYSQYDYVSLMAQNFNPSIEIRTGWNEPAWSVFIGARWSLSQLLLGGRPNQDLTMTYNEIHQQVQFFVENAWHERVLHLRRLARGETNALEIAVLRERIEVLEAAIETWLGHALNQ
jgi:hypothetical protein